MAKACGAPIPVATSHAGDEPAVWPGTRLERHRTVRRAIDLQNGVRAGIRDVDRRAVGRDHDVLRVVQPRSRLAVAGTAGGRDAGARAARATGELAIVGPVVHEDGRVVGRAATGRGSARDHHVDLLAVGRDRLRKGPGQARGSRAAGTSRTRIHALLDERVTFCRPASGATARSATMAAASEARTLEVRTRALPVGTSNFPGAYGMPVPSQRDTTPSRS